LAEHAPALDPELAPDRLGVADDRVGAEVRQVLGLLLRRHPGELADRGRPARAALVEQQHPELLQGAFEPGRGHRSQRPRRLVPGAALEEDEPWQVVPLAVDRDDLAREHGQLACARIAVVDG
jgi:hypothetical protein